MNNELYLNRRQFLRSTGQAATTLAATSTFAPAILSAESSTKTIGVGCIGLGTRGGDLINLVANVPGAKVVAVSDVYAPHRQKGIERSLNPQAKAYLDYRELLADPNVNAVVIAVPATGRQPPLLPDGFSVDKLLSQEWRIGSEEMMLRTIMGWWVTQGRFWETQAKLCGVRRDIYRTLARSCERNHPLQGVALYYHMQAGT